MRARPRWRRHGIGLVWSPNYSMGVNAFFRLVSEAARLLARSPNTSAWAWEIHHSAKKDAPSGTLLKLVEEMRKAGYDAADRRGLEPRGRASRHARNRLRFCGRHNHAAAHGAQPRRFRARRAEGGANGSSGKKGFYEFGEISFGLRYRGGGTCLQDAARRWSRRSGATVRWTKRHCANWCGGRSSGHRFPGALRDHWRKPHADARRASARGGDHAGRGHGQESRCWPARADTTPTK